MKLFLEVSGYDIFLDVEKLNNNFSMKCKAKCHLKANVGRLQLFCIDFLKFEMIVDRMEIRYIYSSRKM